jgi:hypothetical protein
LPFTGLYLETDIGGLKTINLAGSFLLSTPELLFDLKI